MNKSLNNCLKNNMQKNNITPYKSLLRKINVFCLWLGIILFLSNHNMMKIDGIQNHDYSK